MTQLPIKSKEFWDMLEVARMRDLFLQGDMKINDIAKNLGRTRKSVERKLNRIGLNKKNKTIVTYTEEFKSTVLLYYYSTNAKETCEKFNIQQKTLEGFVTKRNRTLKLKSQIKKNEWSTEDVLVFLRYAGLQPIPFIANKLDKTDASVLSYLKRRGYRLRYVNGLPKDIFDKVFERIADVPFMRLTSGDIIIPWVSVEENIDCLTGVDEIQLTIIKSMAMFQRFLHGTKTNRETIEELWLKIEE